VNFTLIKIRNFIHIGDGSADWTAQSKQATTGGAARTSGPQLDIAEMLDPAK